MHECLGVVFIIYFYLLTFVLLIFYYLLFINPTKLISCRDYFSSLKPIHSNFMPYLHFA